MNEALIAEYKQEAASTRKVLERVPTDKFDYKPHPKSMSMGRLATHVAELQGWLSMTMNTSELDFAKGDYKPVTIESNEALLKQFDDNVANSIKTLEGATNEHFMENWSMRNGEHHIFTMPKIAVLRSMIYNHMIHHRGQLTVYLRLNDIPLPGIYGPSADEQ